jgi:hypothetical protein
VNTSVADGFSTVFSVTMLKKSVIVPFDTLNAKIEATHDTKTTNASRITNLIGFHSFDTYFMSIIFIEQYMKVMKSANMNIFSIFHANKYIKRHDYYIFILTHIPKIYRLSTKRVLPRRLM